MPAVTEEAVHVRGPESLLDHLLPRFDVRVVHEAWVPAPADVVYSAVKQLTAREVRILMPLEFLRWLPGFLTGRRPFWPDPSAPLLAAFTVGRCVSWRASRHGGCCRCGWPLLAHSGQRSSTRANPCRFC